MPVRDAFEAMNRFTARRYTGSFWRALSAVRQAAMHLEPAVLAEDTSMYQTIKRAIPRSQRLVLVADADCSPPASHSRESLAYPARLE